MKKILLLSVLLVVAFAGCTQQPTAQIIAEHLEPVPCTPNWICTDWSSCARNGTDTGIQSRTCTDANACGIIAGKPSESMICSLPKVSSKEPQLMTLEVSDLPVDRNWTVGEKNVLSPEEVSLAERSMGFKKGFYIQYLSQSKNDIIYVHHYIEIYPLVESGINMSFSFDSAKESYKVGEPYENKTYKILSISELPDPLIGDLSIAYNITVSDSTGLKKNLYTICFTKWDIAEVITMEGAKISYDLLKGLTVKAEEKIV